MTKLVMMLTPQIQMLRKVFQKSSWTALGFLSQKMLMYLAKTDASSRSRVCHLTALRRKVLAKQKNSGWGPKNSRGISKSC